MGYYLAKTRQITSHSVTVSSLTCPIGHTFYPKIMNDGTIKISLKCPIKSCRRYLDTKLANQGKLRRELNLKYRWKNAKPKEIAIKKIIDNDRPVCRICNLTFYDQKNFETHNKRLHQQN